MTRPQCFLKTEARLGRYEEMEEERLCLRWRRYDDHGKTVSEVQADTDQAGNSYDC